MHTAEVQYCCIYREQCLIQQYRETAYIEWFYYAYTGMLKLRYVGVNILVPKFRQAPLLMMMWELMVELMIVSRLNAIAKLSKYSSAFKSVKCSENYKINH